MMKTFFAAALVSLFVATAACSGDSKSACEKVGEAAVTCSEGAAGTVGEITASCDATACTGSKDEALKCILDYGTCGEFMGNMCNCLYDFECDMPSECMAAPAP